jgi:Neuraminidase (sialidase)
MLGQNINCAGTLAHMLVSKSTDGGETWTTPVRITSVRLVPDSCNCSFFGNLPHTYEPVANPPLIAVDNSKGAHSGNLYVVMYNWTGKQMKVQVTTSTDGGTTWGTPVLVASLGRHDEFFPALSVNSNGIVGVSWLDRRKDPRNVRYQPFAALSQDGGKTFGNNYPLTSRLSDPYFSSNYMGDFTGNLWTGSTLYASWPDTRNSLMQDYVGGLRIK